MNKIFTPLFLASALAAGGQAFAAEESTPSAVTMTDVSAIIASHHFGASEYNSGTQSQPVMTPYNENNPGIAVGLHVRSMPSLLQDWKLAYIAKNSFGKPTTVIAVENALYNGNNAKVSLLTGIVPTGYTKPKPILGLTIEGKGLFAYKSENFETKPYLLVTPGGIVDGTGQSKVVVIMGAKFDLK